MNGAAGTHFNTVYDFFQQVRQDKTKFRQDEIYHIIQIQIQKKFFLPKNTKINIK